MSRTQSKSEDGPLGIRSRIRKLRSLISGRATARAEKRTSNELERRVELALEQAERAGMVYDQQSRRRAASWITRLAAGNNRDLRSNLFRAHGANASYEEIVAAFDERYDLAMQDVEPTLVDVIWKELEEGNREKIGPKSVYKGFYEDGGDKLEAVLSDKPVPDKLDRHAFVRALDRLSSEVPSQSIRLYDVDTVIKTLRVAGEEHDPESPGLDGTTNSGPPFFKSGWKASPDMDKDQWAMAKRVENYISHKAKEQFQSLTSGREVEFWAMVGQRLVNRGLDPLNDKKVKRLILALEKSEAVLWKMFTPQLQERFRQLRCPGGVQPHVAWCDTPFVDENMQLMLTKAMGAGRTVLSGDVSSFDASVVPDLWDEMAKAMSPWFYKSSKFFYNLNRSIIGNVRVLSPLGVSRPIRSSIKSGSGGTNFVDSQYNKLAMFYGEELGLYTLENYSVQGDDFVCDGPGILPDSVSEAYSHLGLTVHPDKQTHAAGILTFLQRLHTSGSLGGIASVYRTLASTLVYEKLLYKSREWNPMMEAIQAISKLENAAFHPAFETLVNFVKQGDKYELGANLSPAEVIAKAGGKASDLLAAQSRFTLNAGALERTQSGFDRAITNGVLRGESLPPCGSRERFLRVYGERRTANLTETQTL